MKAQLSAEMLILIVVVLAIVALVASQLTKATEKTGRGLETQSDIIINRSEATVKARPGEFCSEDSQCLSNQCDTDNFKCQ